MEANQLAGFENFGNPHLKTDSRGSSSQVTTEGSSTSAANADARVYTRLTSPCLTSPTPSSKTRREPRFDLLERSIGRFRLGHGAPSALISRFQKGHGDSESDSEPHKPSLLARLHLTCPRRVKLPPRGFDGSDSDSQQKLPARAAGQVLVNRLERSASLTIEKSDPAPYSPPVPGLRDPDDGATKLWQRAFREGARLREASSDRQQDSHSRRSSFPNENIYNKSKHAARSPKQHSSSFESHIGGHGMGRALTRPITAPVLSSSHKGTPVSRRAMSSTEEIPSTATEQTQEMNTPSVPHAWAGFPSHNRAERNGAVGLAGSVTAPHSAPPAGTEHNILGSSVKSGANLAPRNPKSGQRSAPGRFSTAVKSGFSKLLPSRASSNAGSSKSVKPGRKGSNRYKRSIEYSEPRLERAQGGYREPKALEREIQNLKYPYDAHIPAALRGSNRVTLSAKMTALLRTDGTSEVQATPVPSHAGDSTTTTSTTDKFVTPLSSMSLSQESSSFHSYPRSRPHSRVMIPLSQET